ncbi:ectonucleotide pyrophosphatase/phosphodiesterase [Eubacteriaceae bacterium ES2]|nr:ectonucleotide pyrophosphatase/phosphodiesterase [Eubacteriaceae bacterium ES2]
MTKKAKHLIVISYDAFSEDNWERAKKLPNLKRLIDNGSSTSRLKSIYPTLTYVVHTTMLTGTYPNQHGIYHNNPCQPFVAENDQAWFWYKSEIKRPAIYDLVKENGLKSAGILWPVTGKAAINYNLPEIRAIGRENQLFKILRNGSPLYCVEMEKKFGSLRRGIEEPYLDDFSTACAVDTIKRKMPNLLLVHLIDLDDAKHRFGTQSREVEEAIIRMDGRIGEMIEAVEAAGIINQTSFVVIGDHGQMDVTQKVGLNVLLKEKGLITEKKGKLSWQAYAQSCGGAAYIYIKNQDPTITRAVKDLIDQAITDGQCGIEKCFDEVDMARFHTAAPNAAMMVEARVGTAFSDSLEGPIVYNLGEKKYATHGYDPNKVGYRCNFVAAGPGIKKNFELDEIQMVDIAPSMAQMLGLSFYECDGGAIKEIFE